MIEELKKEREAIAGGGVKTKDGLLSAKERAGDRLNIESRQLAMEFRNLVDARSFVPALRKFEDLQSQYFGTVAHRESLPLFEKLLNSYLRIISGELDSFAANEERRDASYERLSDTDQERARTANEQRMTRLEKVREKEKEDGDYWLTIDTQSEDSLADMAATLQKRIEGLPDIKSELSNLPDVGARYKEGWEAAGTQETEKLERILDDLDLAGVAEKDIDRLVDRYDPAIKNPVAEEGEKEKMKSGGEGQEGAEKEMMSEEDADTDPKPTEPTEPTEQ
jgi:hypothetical protein